MVLVLSGYTAIACTKRCIRTAAQLDTAARSTYILALLHALEKHYRTISKVRVSVKR
jgi:hypothetical protein